jgi:hypothetical protein
MYGPWYFDESPVLNKPKTDEAQFRHLIRRCPDNRKKWFEEEVGYLLFFHIRMPPVTKRETVPPRHGDQPQILRAIVYRFESFGKKKSALLTDIVGPGRGANFQASVKELLKSKGLTVL